MEPIDLEQLRAEVAKIKWYHHIDLGNGIVTPGGDTPSTGKLDFVKLPADLTGMTVLDIGAWDGFFSFEAERRGARRVLATDSYVWRVGPQGNAGFQLARRALKSKVEDREIEVLDIAPETVGTFDLVLFLGVLYHLRHPFLALEKVASVTKQMLILSTWVDMESHDRPAMAFYPTTELYGDPTNWWGANPECLVAMLRDVGFRRIEAVSGIATTDAERSRPHPMALHAWK